MLATTPQNRSGLFLMSSGAGADTVDDHGRQDYGDGRGKRQAEGQQRDVSPAYSGVVGCLRPSHALDGTPAELFPATGKPVSLIS